MNITNADITIVEDWFCTIEGENVPVATAASDGSRRCLKYEECIRQRGICRNKYINVPTVYHKRD